jgi:cytochrome b6-f complex iron-sulfur subunit
MKTRREFLFDVCKLCAVVGVGGFAATALQGCNSIKSVAATTEGENQLRVPVASFEESNQVIVRSKKTSNDILAHRRSDGTYGALLMVCTHESQPLTASGTALYCSSHGSKFDLEGNVVLAPATKSLTKYPVTVSGTDILIELKPIK